jgi:hypothetical protein
MGWLDDVWNDITGVTAANIQAQAATTASGTESAATQTAIDEQKRQFDAMKALLKPYTEAGTQSLIATQDLAGLNGPESQAAAIKAISDSPEMAAMTQQGENAILQQGAATGGLRGGNVQGSLAQFRPQALSSLINQQYGRLGGITQIGQASAAGMAAGGMQHASSLGDLFMRQGSAIAGGQLAAGNAASQAQQLAWQPVKDASQMALAIAMKSMGVF